MAKILDKDLNEYEWRTGRKKSAEAKNVYAQLGETPAKDDILLGTMKSPTVAAQVVNDHNGWFD